MHVFLVMESMCFQEILQRTTCFSLRKLGGIRKPVVCILYRPSEPDGRPHEHLAHPRHHAVSPLLVHAHLAHQRERLEMPLNPGARSAVKGRNRLVHRHR